LGAYYALDQRMRMVGLDQPEVAQTLAQKAAEARIKANRYMPQLEKAERSIISSGWGLVEVP